MTTEAQKTELIEQFQAYLKQSNLDTLSAHSQPDLYSLLSELTGLKSEVKAESRQFKNTLDTLSSALTTVQDDNKALSTELALSAKRLDQQQDDLTRAMLLEFIGIYDSLASGIQVLHNYRPVNTLFKSSRKKDVSFIKRFEEGQIMSLRRFDQLFQRYQVKPIVCVGKMLDPTLMTAVETANNPELENGKVLEELRTGFLYKNQLLRLAEVKVNKLNAQ